MDFRFSISDFRLSPGRGACGSSPLRRPSFRQGFTLIEMLVVVGIIMIVMSLLLVGTSMARRAARKARTSADMQTIGTALEAYKQDFGDYPRLDYTVGGPGPKGPPDLSVLLNPPPAGFAANPGFIAGSELLAWALVGPYDAKPATSPPMPAALVPWRPGDGKDGFGMRVGVNPRGSVYGPYLDPERFLRNPMNDPAEVNQMFRFYYFLQDNFRQPILYFVRNAKPESNQLRNLTDAPRDMYNFNDNGIAFVRADMVNPFDRFKAIVNYRKPEGPYLLWSAGEDEQFSVEQPADVASYENCDDVMFWAGQ